MSEKLPFTFPYNSEEYDVYYGEIILSDIVQVTTNKGYTLYYANVVNGYESQQTNFDLQLDMLIRDKNLLYLAPKELFRNLMTN